MSLIKGRENNLRQLLMIILSFILSISVSFASIQNTPCSNAPNHLNIVQKDTMHIRIGWNSDSPAETLWNIGYKVVGTSTWSEVVANSNPFTVSNLQSGTTYEFRVRADCGTSKSGWSVNNILATTDINNGQGCHLNLSIPDNNCPTGINFNVNVSSAPIGGILGDDVKLRKVNIIVDHPWEQDITLKLIAPNGQSIILASNLGGANIDGYGINDGTCDNYTSFTENTCDANFNINDPSLLSFNGSFFPENSFSGLDGSIANGLWHLQICDDAPDHVGKLVFIELELSPFNCSAPTGVYVTDESETSLVVHWDPVISGEESRISVVEEGFPLSSATLFLTNDDFYEVSNLQLNTNYEIFVQRKCIGNRFSDFSCLVYGQTRCNGNVPTIIENFDLESDCLSNCGAACSLNGFWKNTTSDGLDWSIAQGSTPTAFTGPTDDVTRGGKYLYLESSNIACSNGEGILTSNCTHVIAPFSGCHLGFSYFMYGLEVNSLKLEINDFSGTGWATIWQKTGNQRNQWLKAYLDLSAYDGKDVQFRITGKTGTNGNSDIAIDDFEFYGSLDNGLGAYAYYRDQDGDNFGDDGNVLYSCLSNAPVGYIAVGGDCDDTNPMINPNGVEIMCNQIDENCNGMADDSDIDLLQLAENKIEICYGESAELKVVSNPSGRVEWYDAAQGGNLLTTGLIYETGALNHNQSYYVQDAVEIGSGLKITQIFLNYNNSGVEIQNIDVAHDYTGWKVFVSDDRLNINNFIAVPWELGNMAVKQVMTRTNSNWGANFKWLSGSFFKGWVMLLDENNVVQDVVFWNWSNADIQSLSTTINGTPITASNIPWSGDGFSQGSCGGGQQYNILLTGNDESNSSADYECGSSNFGQPNPNLDYFFNCISGRSKVDVVVSKILLDERIYQNTCEPGGSVEIIPSNGIVPYTYLWSNGADSRRLNNVSPDNYKVTVTDGIGCTSVSRELNLSGATNEFGIEILGVNQISCNEAKDGKIIMKVLDGQSPFQFNWTGGFERDLPNALDSIEHLDGGNYILTVTDDNGCVIISDEISIIEPDRLLLSIDSVVNLKCKGLPTGAIFTSINGGILPYQFDWNNDIHSEDLLNQPAGNYQLTVTDANECSIEIETEILEPKEALAGEIKEIKNVTCYGLSDGMIEVSSKGGIAGYHYKWSNGFTKAKIDNLAGGDYEVTISDGNDCKFVFDDAIKIQEPNTPLQIAPTIRNEKCEGRNDGEIVLHTTGGIPPYTYNWSENKSDGDTLSGLSAGVYICTLTDNFGCPKLTDKIVVNLDDYDLAIQSEVLENVSCHDMDDGSIHLNIEGGTSPYNVKWNNDSIGKNQDNLGKGIYFATVSDAFGCNIETNNFSISEPDALNIDTIYLTNQSNSDVSNGVATVIVSGGTWPYTYQWSDENHQTKQTAIGLKKGDYEVTITDANGCELIGNCSIIVVANKEISFTEDISMFPNPAHSIVNIQYNGLNDLYFSFYSNLGQQIIVPYLQKNHFYQFDISNLNRGIYFINIHSSLGENKTFRLVIMN